jgi:hypothetical protein
LVERDFEQVQLAKIFLDGIKHFNKGAVVLGTQTRQIVQEEIKPGSVSGFFGFMIHRPIVVLHWGRLIEACSKKSVS